MAQLLITLYIAAVAGLAVYGLLGLVTLWLYWRHRHDEEAHPSVADDVLPRVTVQLPIYNERFVVERLIRAAAELDYPPDRLEIQVLDDSTDATTAVAAATVRRYREQGINVRLLHREHRRGYKAGALAAGLAATQGEFVAIFDADFVPDADFLRQTVPFFLANPDLGMIQARWGHINDSESALTAAQAIALDKHFMMEQTVRHRSKLFPKFNGAAGIWRRECVEDAGGWQDDTVCEDLCLSTRAVLKGWQFQFLPRVTAPAELPASVLAYKNQQARWAKGSVQCLRKFGWAILRDRQHSLLARLYALLSMSAYLTHLLLVVLLLLQVPLLLLDLHLPPALVLFSILGVGQPLLFVAAQRTLYKDWAWRLRHMPTLLLIAIGTAASNSRAILGGLLSGEHVFVRTPKRGRETPADGAYRLPADYTLAVELFLAAYAAVGIALALALGEPAPLFLLGSCFLGFSYVAGLGLYESFARGPRATRALTS